MEVRVFSAAPFLVLQLNYSFDLQAIYLQQSTWVDNMVDKSDASYLYQKRGVYYFSKQVPCDVKQHYSRNRIVICLRTKSYSKAMRFFPSLRFQIQRLLQNPLVWAILYRGLWRLIRLLIFRR